MARIKNNNPKLDKSQEILAVEEEYVRPPEPIRINKMVLDSKGTFTISANGDVEWPDVIRSLFNRTQELKSQNMTNLEIRRGLKATKGGGSGYSGMEDVLNFTFQESISMK